MKHTIVIGNIRDGFELYGVFDTRDEAIEEAQQLFDDQDWVIAPINPTPTE